MGRTPMLSKTDLLVSHEFAVRGTQKLRFELNVLNLFNQKTATHIFNYLNRGGGGMARSASAMNLSGVDLTQGYDYNALIRATLGRLSSRTIRATGRRISSRPARRVSSA